MIQFSKEAFIEALPTFTGLAAGYGPGRSVAGETAAAIAPEGRMTRSENIARSAAVVGAPLGGLAAMALAKKYRLAPQLAEYVGKRFPGGVIADPSAEQELVNLGVPGAGAIVGSLAGGAATGAVVGGLQRLRGPGKEPEKVASLKPSPMWSRIGGGAARKPLWQAQSGFTPTGFKTPAQRLSKSMDMGKFDSSKGLKPIDYGAAAKAATDAVKMGSVLLAITKVATGQPIPVLEKEADDGGHGGFSTNAYSGVMNPPAMVYKSGIPAWKEPPVKTAGEKTILDLINEELAKNPYILNEPPRKPRARAKTAAPITPVGRLASSKAVGAPKVTPAPGPSIAQIAKPKGFGLPMSGAKKGNNTI